MCALLPLPTFTNHPPMWLCSVRLHCRAWAIPVTPPSPLSPSHSLTHLLPSPHPSPSLLSSSVIIEVSVGEGYRSRPFPPLAACGHAFLHAVPVAPLQGFWPLDHRVDDTPALSGILCTPSFLSLFYWQDSLPSTKSPVLAPAEDKPWVKQQDRTLHQPSRI